MSLKSFHVLFITCSVLLAFGFAAWCLTTAPPEADSGWLAAGVLSLAAGVGMAGYETWFLKKMRRLP